MATTNNIIPRACSKCHNEYPPTAEYFGVLKGGKDGIHSWCRKCLREYDRIRNKTPQRRERDRLRSIERYKDPSVRKWHSDYTKQRYVTDEAYKQKILQASAVRYADPVKREHKRANDNRHYHNEGKAVHKAGVHRRRSREKNLPNTLTATEWERCLTYFDNCCAVCGKRADFWTIIALDHWIPISSPDCPGNVATNVVPLCHAKPGVPSGEPACNLSKHHKLPQQWLIHRFGEQAAKEILQRIETYFEWVRASDE